MSTTALLLLMSSFLIETSTSALLNPQELTSKQLRRNLHNQVSRVVPSNLKTSTFLEFPNCDFETDYCDWHIDEELNGTEFFAFIRSKGSIHENSNDGPIVDHDMNKEGRVKVDKELYTSNKIFLTAYFLWANALLGTPGLLTSISSKPINTENNLCFNFWFDLTVSKVDKCLKCKSNFLLVAK